MKYLRRVGALILCAAMTILPVGAAENDDDPVISKSYLESVFSGEFIKSVGAESEKAGYDLEADTIQQAAEILAGKRLAKELTLSANGQGALYTVKNDTVTVSLGTTLTVQDGALVAFGSGLIDITSGNAVSAGSTLTQNHTYISADNVSGYTTSTYVGHVVFDGFYARQRSNSTDYASRADALAKLGLFRGSAGGYELNRSATRTEALVMFLRILGLEDAALRSTAVNPFYDVPAWADRYAAYAYEKGLVRGVADHTYNAAGLVTANDYMTFLMRALGYVENQDFNWSSAVSDAAHLDILNLAERQELTQHSFLRAHMANLSWQAMLTQKANHQLLLRALQENGTVSAKKAAEALCSVVGTRLS